jgi:formylglycine-generating enzyme required for sulfatase activity
MHGNVYEWCHDVFAEYAVDGERVDPQGPPQGIYRVLRGGAFDYASSFADSSYRTRNRPTYRSYTIGFRVVRNSSTPDRDVTAGR